LRIVEAPAGNSGGLLRSRVKWAAMGNYYGRDEIALQLKGIAVVKI
jgi:hypothetical protein